MDPSCMRAGSVRRAAGLPRITWHDPGDWGYHVGVMPIHGPSRRAFVKSAVAGFPAIVPSRVLGQDAPSNKRTIGFIGTGNNGTNWMRMFLRDERVRVVAVCDVNRESDGYWDGSVRGRDPARAIVNEHYGDNACLVFSDFRELIDRSEADAVYIATPDHWHAIIAIAAAKAGKDIYCQKPLSLTVREGRAISDAVRTAGIVWQTGSQQRSDSNFRRVCEAVRNNRLGKIHTVRVGLPPGRPDYGKTAHLTDPAPVPDGLDYEMWLGPAPAAPYSPARVGVNFRWVSDYSGGQVTDWGAHHLDIAQWGLGMDASGPVAIRSAKGKFEQHPVYDTATEFHFECEYKNGVRLICSSRERRGGTLRGKRRMGLGQPRHPRGQRQGRGHRPSGNARDQAVPERQPRYELRGQLLLAGADGSSGRGCTPLGHDRPPGQYRAADGSGPAVGPGLRENHRGRCGKPDAGAPVSRRVDPLMVPSS